MLNLARHSIITIIVFNNLMALYEYKVNNLDVFLLISMLCLQLFFKWIVKYNFVLFGTGLITMLINVYCGIWIVSEYSSGLV